MNINGGLTLNNVGIMITSGGLSMANGDVTITPVNGVTVSGSVYATQFISPNAMVGASDMRLKTDITQLTNPLRTISHLRGVFFSWKDMEAEGIRLDTNRHVGLIAQDVQAVLPEIVEPIFNNQYLGIRQSELIPLLVEGIKELDTRTSANGFFALTNITLTDMSDRTVTTTFDEVNTHLTQLYKLSKYLLEENARLLSRIVNLERKCV